MISINQVLEKKLYSAALSGSSADSILSQMIELGLKRSGQFKSAEQVSKILCGVMEREKLGSTGIGRGIAIPHFVDCEVDASIFFIGRSASEIEYNSLDGDPVQLFFLVISSDVETRIRSLALIAKAIHANGLVDSLLDSNTDDQMREVLLNYSNAFEQEKNLGVPAQIEVKLVFPPDSSDEMIQNAVVDAAIELNNAYREAGGAGLRIDDVSLEEPAVAPMGAPQ
ncbi:MAG: PTS sugar transporter subunit IIA [Pirellulaceae bacterium]